MRTIAVVNMKGGVGKTATVINVAAVLARDYRQQVLVIDADSQCNTTEFFGGEPAEGNLAALLRMEPDPCLLPEEAALAVIQDSNFEDVDLICGDDSLMDLDLSKVEGQAVNVTVLRELRQCLAALGDENEDCYDWVLIDCPPAFNAASAAALLMADEVLVPISWTPFPSVAWPTCSGRSTTCVGSTLSLSCWGAFPPCGTNHPGRRRRRRCYRPVDFRSLATSAGRTRWMR